MPSKNELCKEILKIITGKTLIFGNSLKSLNEITKNVISSKNTADKNIKILEDFQSEKITTIGSFKMLEQGANLSKLNNIILHSYYGKEKSFIQRLGRGRKDINSAINLIVILTQGTQEEVWFRNMISDLEITQHWCYTIEHIKEKYHK